MTFNKTRKDRSDITGDIHWNQEFEIWSGFQEWRCTSAAEAVRYIGQSRGSMGQRKEM